MNVAKNPNRLMYSRANQAFVFTFGDQLLRMGDNPMFYRQKSDAIRAALRQGLLVDKQGHITSVESDEGLNGTGFDNAVDLGVRSVMKVEGKTTNTPARWVAWESTEGKNKPELLVAIEQQINGKWWPAGGPWSVEMLVNGSRWSAPHTSDEIAIDFGAKWYGTNTMVALDAARKLSKGGNLGEASALEGIATLRTRVGTRVRFTPNPASYALYCHCGEPSCNNDPPEIGEEGTVATVSFGGAGKRSSLKGPGGGLLYIEWDEHGYQGVSPRDVEVIGKSKSKSKHSAGQGIGMLSRDAYEAAKDLYTERNNQGMGYTPFTDVVGDDTVEAAIEAAESDDWEVVWVANDPSEITVLKNGDGDMLGIGGDGMGRNSWAVDLSEHLIR